jgi:hypothetical protein
MTRSPARTIGWRAEAMGEIVIDALLAALYPTLIAAATVMVLLPKAGRLMLGFWAGAMVMSVTCGLVVVFALSNPSAAHTTRTTVRPVIDLVFGALLGLLALALAKRQDERLREKHAARHPAKEKKTPKWQRQLQDGNPWRAFAVGVVLSFPGGWYLAALIQLDKLNYAAGATVIIILGFCIVQLALIEVPMLAFKLWPEQTPAAIDRAKVWGASHGRHYGVWFLSILSVILILLALDGFLA